MSVQRTVAWMAAYKVDGVLTRLELHRGTLHVVGAVRGSACDPKRCYRRRRVAGLQVTHFFDVARSKQRHPSTSHVAKSKWIL